MGSIVVSAEPVTHSSWQVPPFEDLADHKTGWVEEQIQEGEGFLSSQKSYINLAANMRIFDGIFTDRTRSTLRSNFLKFNIRKFVETISDVREIAIFGTEAPQYKPYSDVLNRVAKFVYGDSQYPRQLRKALQYSSVMGQGYLWPKCTTLDYGFGRRQIVFEPLGVLDVVPVQVPATNDVQDAYACTIFDYMPIAEAHGRFPLFQSSLKPVDQSKYQSRLQARRLDWAERFRYGGETRNWGALYCEIRYTFVRDLRINTTGYKLPMGQEDTSWYYEVPSLGDPIFGGFRNGQPFTREATNMDCRVYPQLRLIITSPGVPTPLYDGPAFDWHGRIPAVQYVVDDWPWEALGISLVENVSSIELTKRKHERHIDQVLTSRMNPPMGYDRTATGGPKIENFDIFAENVRAGVDGVPRNVLQSLLPEEVQITQPNFEFLNMLSKMEEGQLGINDLTNLETLKLNLDADSFDKALEAIGPVAKGIAASMEAANAKIAYMLKFMIPQWMPTGSIVKIVGPNDVPSDVFDYEPYSLIPSHLPDEYINGAPPATTSYYAQNERTRFFADNLSLASVPSTLLKITQLQEQLKYLQLYRGQFPISPHTVAHKLGIDNYGEIAGDTEFEKWVNWKKMEIALMAEGQQIAQQLGVGDSPTLAAGALHAGGRPPTAQAAPDIKQKGKNDGNPRTTITESK